MQIVRSQYSSRTDGLWLIVVDQGVGGVAVGFGNQLLIYLRVATDAEPPAYTWHISGSQQIIGVAGGILSFSGVDPGNPIVAQAGQATRSQSIEHAAPSIDTGVVANTMLVSVHSVNSSSTWSPPAAMTESVDIASEPPPSALGLTLGINYQKLSAPGVTGPRTATLTHNSAFDTGATYMLALRPINIAIPGSFNAFESNTPAGAVAGRLFTKLAGVGFFADIVAINGGIQLTSFNEAVIVDLVANTGGALLDGNNCPAVFQVIQTVAPNPIISGGRATINFFHLTSAFRDVRVRVRYPASSPTVASCSADNFAVRPTGLTVTSSNATQTGSSGAPAIKTGENFNLTAASITGYDGVPRIDNTKITGTPYAGTIGGSFTAASPLTGVASGNGFFYSEVGHFGLDTYAVFDGNYTAVDHPDDCTADFSNIPVNGKYGCSFGSAAIPQVTGSSGFGRFIPDNFAVTLNTPEFQTTCGSGGFTYIGKPFVYSIAPALTVTARNGTNNGLTNSITRNYAGVYMKLTNTSLAPVTQAARYVRFDALGNSLTPVLDTSVLPATSVDPAIGIFSEGSGVLQFSSGTTGLAFVRGTLPTAPFNADIALTIHVIDTDGVFFSGNPVSFGTATAGNGIAFSNGKEMLFGRLHLKNAFGSELLALPIPIAAQYWNGSGFVTNSRDHCTQISNDNVGLTNYTGNLLSGATSVATGGVFSSGIGKLTLSAPGVGNIGSVDIVANLGTTSTEATCIAMSPDPSTTGASLAHLRGKWCDTHFDKDPVARAIFGVYKGSGEIIYMRELY